MLNKSLHRTGKPVGEVDRYVYTQIPRRKRMNWNNQELPKWTTQIFVNGPIDIDENITFKSRKDIEYGDPLYSNIIIKKDRDGVKLSVNSFAEHVEFGKKAALIFSGLALDVLSLKTRCPLYVSLYAQKQRYNFIKTDVLRTVTEDEWKFAFRESRLLTLTEPTFLRALSWYRKGLVSEDPFDKFLGVCRINPTRISLKHFRIF